MADTTRMSEIEKKLYEEMKDSIKNMVPESTKIGISFSGGVDSSLLANMIQDLNYNMILLTMGFDDSHDVEFSKKMAKIIGIEHQIELISTKNFSEIAKRVWEKINIENLSWNENCIAFYYVAKLAQKNDINQVITANGIDELFCGYNSYREFIPEGEEAVQRLMNEKLDNEIRMMKTVNQITSEFGVQIIQPFLSSHFIEFAKTIPLEYKIKNKDDLARKHIIRNLALLLGVPEESALKQKKAMQYGSLIHKNFLKVKKTWNMSF